MLLYLAGPYSASETRTVEFNIAVARNVAISLWNQGHTVLCPHLNTANLEHDVTFGTKDTEAQYMHWIMHSLNLLRRCDAIVLLPNWTESRGARTEHEYALEQKIPVYEWCDAGTIIPEHPTKQNNPNQCKVFMETIMRMYRLHLDKNRDYSPANILGTGEIGLITRLWDKMARLLSLSGFQIRIKDSQYVGSREAVNESIDDSYLDLANYAVIGRLLRMGYWGW